MVHDEMSPGARFKGQEARGVAERYALLTRPAQKPCSCASPINGLALVKTKPAILPACPCRGWFPAH